jgi:putative phage-type endonuclease
MSEPNTSQSQEQALKQLPVSWLKSLLISETRNKGLGGSDLAAVVGISPFKTPFDVWLDKTGQSEPEQEKPWLEWGNRLEPVIAKAYSDKTGVALIKNSVVFQHPKHSWFIGTPDYLRPTEPRGLDCKTSSGFSRDKWGEEGTDQIPDYYIVQAQWYMTLTGAHLWDIPVLIGGNDFRSYIVRHNEDLEDALLNAAEKFWTKHVLGETAPEMLPSTQAEQWLRRRFAKNREIMRKANAEEEGLASELLSVREGIETREKKKAEIEMKLKASIGPSEGIEGDFGKITWKSNKDSQKIDWEGIAKKLGAHLEIISSFTTTKSGARVLRVSDKNGE